MEPSVDDHKYAERLDKDQIYGKNNNRYIIQIPVHPVGRANCK